MKSKCIGLAAGLLLLAAPALAADKTKICLNATTKDTVGTTLAFTLKEQLLASQSYDLQIKCTDAVFVVNLTTIENDGGSTTSGLSTAAALTLAIENVKGFDYLVMQWVLTSGRDRVGNSATNMIAAIDKQIQDILKEMAK
jgi:hypothetical protein